MGFQKQQKGLSFVGWLVLILIFGGGLTLGLKLVPLYVDYNIQSKVMEQMATEINPAISTNGDIKDMLKKRFEMNNIRGFDYKKNFSIDRRTERTRLILDYKVDIPVIANVDLLVSFHKEVELRSSS